MGIEHLKDLPYTVSFVIKKRIQIDNFMELPKKKRPSSKLIWEGTHEELSEWLESVLSIDKDKKNKTPGTIEFIIPESQIEG